MYMGMKQRGVCFDMIYMKNLLKSDTIISSTNQKKMKKKWLIL